VATLNEQIKALTTQISRQLEVHADQQIFTSLPRSGRIRAARLLAEIGDCRGRFPTPDSLICLAGVAHPPANPAKAALSISAGPVTKTSATPYVTSPATAAKATPGPPTSTNRPATAATTTPTRSGFSPAHGCS
jgi:hypothetical protein